MQARHERLTGFVKNRNKMIKGDIAQYREGEQTCSVAVHELIRGASATEKILKQQPDWLKDKGSREQQIMHLGENVQILVSESFSYKVSENFDGYVVNSGESQISQG